MFALAIHHLSPRREQPFVALNCAGRFRKGWWENELFGHERGASRGPERAGREDGLAQSRNTFLDEIGELPLAIQAKLLRVLEERKILKSGRDAVD